MSDAYLVVVAALILGAAVVAVLAFVNRHRLSNALRTLISLVCLPPAAFSVFGFMASFEPGVSTAWKIGYAIAVVSFMAAGIAPWLGRAQTRDS